MVEFKTASNDFINIQRRLNYYRFINGVGFSMYVNRYKIEFHLQNLN